jgi:hypothetical protein
MTQRSFTEESMDTSHSPVMVPVCAGLKSAFDVAASEPMPVDLTRLVEALDDAYARGELDASDAGPPARS